MKLYSELLERTSKLSVIGLGYVGMPLAIAFAKKNIDVVGFDLNEEKINIYKSGKDPINEVGDEAIKNTSVYFTANEEDLSEVRFHIISVPTPINSDKTPNLNPVKSASETVGRHLKRGSIVVYESTVYPGVTEDICIPILEKESGLLFGKDFKVGYSPERINPGDKVNTLEKIVKIVSGSDDETLNEIAAIYELIVEVGVHRASSIKVAEAAKVVENSQRDINIAFMNELAIVFNKMGIDTNEVVRAMNTKWNSLKFYPGLVGGHCIGVDPYYFIYQAEKLGYHSQIIASGRKINDSMGEFVADNIVKKLIHANKIVKQAKVVILGLTFKENCPDIRNSKVEDIIKKLRDYGIFPVVVDPWADSIEAYNEYQVELYNMDEITDADCLVFAVSHNEFKELTTDKIESMFIKGNNEEKVIVDVKSILNKEEIETKGYIYWNL